MGAAVCIKPKQVALDKSQILNALLQNQLTGMISTQSQGKSTATSTGDRFLLFQDGNQEAMTKQSLIWVQNRKNNFISQTFEDG